MLCFPLIIYTFLLKSDYTTQLDLKTSRELIIDAAWIRGSPLSSIAVTFNGYE